MALCISEAESTIYADVLRILIRNIILIDDIAIFSVFRYLLVALIYYINFTYVCQGFNQYRRSNRGTTIIASQNAKMVIYK